MNDSIIIGIDLGTTNSEVAVIENQTITVIPVGDQKILPSVVGLADDGAILVGQAAKNQYALYPERTIKSVKREMGKDTLLCMGDQTYRPQEISAMILKQLKSIAENYLGVPVHKAVITVPAYFSDAQRKATREAGEIAGLEVVRMINEPTAAALAYEANTEQAKRVMVYDLGGGTFDVSVVSIEREVVEVLSSHGNNHLGGDDFDGCIVTALIEHLAEQGIQVENDQKVLARLRRAAEQAKIHLSDNPFAVIAEAYLTTHKGNPYNLEFELSRQDYEAMIDAFVDETLEAVHRALNDAGLNASDIDEVLLVGGSTRTPLIQQRLKEEMNLQPRSEIDPDLCVAVGAAMQGATIAGHKAAAVLVDVTPYTFGTSALAECDGELYPYVYVPMIHRNTPLPVKKSEVFSTMIDSQPAVEINIYQGEDPDALNNIPIGQFMVEGLSKVPRGNPIVLTLALDLDGILKVTAMEKDSGLQKSITIEGAMKEFDEDHIQEAQKRLEALFGESIKNEIESAVEVEGEIEGEVIVAETSEEISAQSRHLVTQSKALVEKAERLLENAGEDDRDDLVDQIEKIKDCLAAHDYDGLPEAIEELSDLIYYLET